MTGKPVDSTLDIHGCTPIRSPQGFPGQILDKARFAIATRSRKTQGGNRVATFGVGEFVFRDSLSANL